MNVRSLLLAAASLAALSTIAACGGSGNGAPKIRAFTASPATVPSLGADVQLVWDVRKAEEVSIEPLVGVVTGTAATVHVTETTTFVLTAKRNGRASHKRATVTVAGPNAVSGVVRTVLSRQPIPNLVVWIKGHGATYAAADGTFTFDEVETPYDIAVVDPTSFFGPYAVVYLGVTRPDPVLEMDEDFALFRQAPLNGTVLPPPPPNTETTLNVDSTGALPEPWAVTNTSFTASVSWWNTETDDISLHVYRTALDSTGNLAGYTGYADHELQVTNNVAAVAGVTLAPVGTDVTTGTVSVAGSADVADVRGFFVFGTPTGTFADEGFFLAPDTKSIGPAPGQFTVRSPAIADPGLYARFNVTGVGGAAAAYLPLEAGSTSNEITLPAPPRLLTPVDGSILSRDTVLRAATREDSVKVFFLRENAPFSSYGVAVITHESEFVVPDLREIGLDVFTRPSIVWDLHMEIAPRSSVDEAVGPDGIAGLSPEWLGYSEAFVLNPEGAQP